MLLVIEVGNTNTKIGVFDGARLLVSWRLTSRREQTADEYGVFIETLLRTRGIGPQDIQGVAISNVVPPVEQTLRWMSEKYFGIDPFSVEPGMDCGLTLAVDNPGEVGADRVVKSVAARSLYGAPLIVIDFGTATTFDCVDAGGVFIGGAIAPGLATSVDALPAARRASTGWSWCALRPPSGGTPPRTSSPGSSMGTPVWWTASSTACDAKWTRALAWWPRAGTPRSSPRPPDRSRS